MRSIVPAITVLALIGVVVPVAAKKPTRPPVVHLIAPVDEAVVIASTPVTFAASALDLSAIDLTDALVWTSSIDGELGRGGVVVHALSPGIHRIKAIATSADGRAGSGTLIVTAVPQTLEVAPDVDTYVDSAKPGKSFDLSTILQVDGSPARATVLSFTVDGVGPARVERAVLRLTVSRKEGAGSKSGGDLLLLDLSDSSALAKTLGTIGRVRPGQVVDFDVTSAVRRNGTYGFALLGSSADGVIYKSEEAAHGGPRLVLTLGSRDAGPPPPAAPSGGFRTLAASGGTGYEDYDFGGGVDQNDNRITGAKPESKLWFQDGRWWATLWVPSASSYRINYLDAATQRWVDTGVAIDERPRSRQDVLQAGGKLYVASRFGGSPAQNRLYRYTYVTGTRTWALDAGFPVNIPGGGTESMTIARDTRGVLWIAYTLDSTVFVSHTTGSDTAWATPFELPVAEGTSVDADDIAAVIAFSGKIGVFWSNQSTDKFYFAVRDDNAGSTTSAASWKLEIVATGGHVADDHFNLKLAADGRLFATIKTSKTAAADTLVGLFVRASNGAWSPLYNVTTVASNPTRPILLLDEARNRVMIFYSADHANIQYKESDMTNIAFPSGSGTPFIESTSTDDINNPTSTKQNLTPQTGLTILASSAALNSYWHNAIDPTPTTTTTTIPSTTSTTVTSTTTTSRPPTTVPSTTTTSIATPTTTTRPPTTTTTTTRPPTTTTSTTLPPGCVMVLGIPVCL